MSRVLTNMATGQYFYFHDQRERCYFLRTDKERMKSQILAACLLALALPLGAAPAIPTNAPAAKMMIVTCREDADLVALLAAHQIKPRFIYRAINGFAAALPEAAIEGLKHNQHVLAVEADGPVSLCA